MLEASTFITTRLILHGASAKRVSLSASNGGEEREGCLTRQHTTVQAFSVFEVAVSVASVKPIILKTLLQLSDL